MSHTIFTLHNGWYSTSLRCDVISVSDRPNCSMLCVCMCVCVRVCVCVRTRACVSMHVCVGESTGYTNQYTWVNAFISDIPNKSMCQTRMYALLTSLCRVMCRCTCSLILSWSTPRSRATTVRKANRLYITKDNSNHDHCASHTITSIAQHNTTSSLSLHFM